MGVCIVGWAHTPFGRLDGQDLESLITSVTQESLIHAGVGPREVDGIWLGQLNGGFVPEIFPSSLVAQSDEGLRWAPATRVENACASGAAALYAACDAIEAGRALTQAGCTVRDRSLAEVHDCFTIAELLSYEAMGLAEPGQGARLLAEGVAHATDSLPINPSGGLKAKGHPIAATGVSMHVLAAMQLMGEAGAMQVRGAELAGVFNMGGSAVASYVSILERQR